MNGRGVFFDGKSSNPQPVELRLDSDSAFLAFDTSAASDVNWHLSEIEIDHIGSAIDIRYKNQPMQSIKTDDVEFIRHLKKVRRERGYTGLYHRLIDLGIGGHILLAFGILGLIGAVYWFVLPPVAEKAVDLIPESYDTELGNTFFEQYVDYETIDSAKTAAVQEFASHLKLRNTKKIRFTVVNSPVVNAFALPDGNVVIFTGIIDLMKDYDELAGLIGHEVAHVNNRHSLKMMCRNLAGYLFLSAVLSDVNGVMAVIGDNVNSLRSLTYSRHFEHEADEQGLQMLIDNHVDPKGMSALFTRLQEEHDQFLPEFLSSHPVTSERIKFIDETIAGHAYDTKDDQQMRDIFKRVKD